MFHCYACIYYSFSLLANSKSEKGSGSGSGSGSQISDPNCTISHSSDNDCEEELNLVGESFFDVGEAMPIEQEAQWYSSEHGVVESENEEYGYGNGRIKMNRMYPWVNRMSG